MVGIETPPNWSFDGMRSNTGFENEGHRLLYENTDAGFEVYLEYIIDRDATEEEQKANRDYMVHAVLRDTDSDEVIDRDLFGFGGGDDPKTLGMNWAKSQMGKY